MDLENKARNISGACLSSNDSLPIDTACLSVVNDKDHLVTLMSIPTDCFLCFAKPVADLPPHSNTTIQVSTKYALHLVYNDTGAETPYILCGRESYSLYQYGHYGFNITNVPDRDCTFYTLYEPNNPYLPLIAALMLYLVSAIIIFTSKLVINVVRVYLTKSTEGNEDLNRASETDSIPQMLSVSKVSMRIHALDAFRGIAVLLMIFVNNGGGKYVFLNHSAWNGLTVADLVLPWFAWAMGFTLVNSIRVHLRVSISRTRLIVKQLRRTALLVLFGLMINSKSNPSLESLRFPGVLQLLAISYFICSVIETCFASPQRTFQFGRFMFLQDILERWAQWLVVIAIIIIHTCITFLLPVPGCRRGYLGPGGYHHYDESPNCTAGAAGYIDRLIFGKHMYNKTHNDIYGPTLPHDPEGFMNTISATLIVFMGVQAGRIYVTYYQAYSRLIRWLIWFAVLGLIAGLLCNFSREFGVIPVNKNMMSLSFVFCTSSFAFLLFAVLYFLIDHKKYWSGAPFIYAGANSILLYIGHYLVMGLFPFAWEIPGVPTHASVLAMNLWTTTLWAFIAYLLYKKEILITI